MKLEQKFQNNATLPNLARLFPSGAFAGGLRKHAAFVSQGELAQIGFFFVLITGENARVRCSAIGYAVGRLSEGLPLRSSRC